VWPNELISVSERVTAKMLDYIDVTDGTKVHGVHVRSQLTRHADGTFDMS